MKQHKVFIILKYYSLPKYQKRDQSAAYYSCEKTRLAVYITSRIMPRGVKLKVIYRTKVHIHLLPYVDTDWIKSILTEIDCLYGVNSLPPTISIWAAYCHCVLYSVLYNLQDYTPGIKLEVIYRTNHRNNSQR